MKTKHFILIFVGIIIVMILSFTLQCLFSEITGDFDLSCGSFFLSVFCLFCYKNALKPSEKFVRNSTKRHYEKKGELPKYQKICKILFIITIGFGTLIFIKGTGLVLIHYIKLGLSH